MSEPQTLNINAATERQIKEHLRVGISKARLIIMKRNQQPEKCFTHESFLVEVRQMERASEWVEGGLISFGPPQTPKSKKPRGAPRQPKRTSTPISEKGQGRTSSPQMSPPLTSPEGEDHGEGETGLLGSGVMGPVGEGMPQGSVPVPMTPVYTPYQQPQVQPGFGLGGPHRPISPRGDGLGASPINPSGRPRFPAYTGGHPPFASQQNPTGFNPRTPWDPPMGFPRGPPPGFPPKYSQVMATRGEQIYSPPSGDARYGDGEGFQTGNLVIPNQSLNGFPGTEVVVPGEPEGNPTSPDNESQVPNEPEPNVGDHATPEENEIPKESGVGLGDATTDTNEIPEGQGSGGMMPNKGDPDDPNNGDPENLDDPHNKPNPVNPDDPKAEIEALQQQLAQAQEALAKSAKTLQKRAAQDSQINNLRELVQKQQGEFDAQIRQYQTREKEQEKASYQASLDRQQLWEQERQKEQAEWVERQRAWEEERKREQAKWKAREKAWKERSQRELQEREWEWAKELEKKKREWEREQKWETRSKNGVPNGGQKVLNNSGQYPRQMGYQYQDQNPQQNNQMGFPSPKSRQPSQRGRGGNLDNTPQGGHARVNGDRNQVYTYRNQYIPVREPKLSKYDGRIPWRVYEVKLLHLAKRYQWDDDTKLAKLVEALEDKALTFFSNLPSNVQVNFGLVRKKMNNRFMPQEPAITVRKQLQTIHQNTEEALEEWAERCQQCAYDAWGKISPEVAEQAAIEAFLGGVIETEAAFTVLEKDPQTVDEALEFLKKAVHSHKSLCCKFHNTQRKVRTISTAPNPIAAEVRTTDITSSPYSTGLNSEIWG